MHDAGVLESMQHLLDDDEEPLKLLAMVTGSLRDWIEIKESGGGYPVFRGGKKDDGHRQKLRGIGEGLIHFADEWPERHRRTYRSKTATNSVMPGESESHKNRDRSPRGKSV